MANKLRAMGTTWDPKESYKGNVVIAAIEQSFQNGFEKGKAQASTECENKLYEAYRQGQLAGYHKGLSDGSSDLVELARLLKKILREVNDDE